jgi:hypothetical protein
MLLNAMAVKQRAMVSRDHRILFSQAIMFWAIVIYAAVTLPTLSSLLAEIDSTHSKLNVSSSMSLTTALDNQRHHSERDESSLAIGQMQQVDEHKPLDGHGRDDLKIVWLMSFPNSG